ncbi:hypothetical protein PIROE2DRAFT_5791 [Piromyces sp. E2]|nr:hypothetical protein PIROE2DRAFT_5791 [Piromyces sp. E2]|eukprot:OUM66931.1 hypothetical protein PIROE2DRAFT_5791 [Piromyces sp. E2]
MKLYIGQGFLTFAFITSTIIGGNASPVDSHKWNVEVKPETTVVTSIITNYSTEYMTKTETKMVTKTNRSYTTYTNVSYQGTIGSEYYLGVNDLKKYIQIPAKYGGSKNKPSKYLKWLIKSEDKPSYMYLANTKGDLSNYCLNVGSIKNNKSYYLSISECSKSTFMFKYREPFIDSNNRKIKSPNNIIVYKNSNTLLTNNKGIPYCLYYTDILRIEECKNPYDYPNFNWKKMKNGYHTQITTTIETIAYTNTITTSTVVPTVTTSVVTSVITPTVTGYEEDLDLPMYTEYEEEYEHPTFSLDDDIPSEYLEILPSQKFEDFDISVFCCLNLMSGANPKREAYFKFKIEMDKKEFLKKYEIDYILLNNKHISNEKLLFEYDPNGFRFYSIYFKNQNKINMIIRNKETNQTYLKEFDIETEIVY